MFGDPSFFKERLRTFAAPGRTSRVDVLLHSTNGQDDPNSQPPRCEEPFAIGDRLWVCRLPDDLRDVVYQACESPGVPYQEANRQYGQLYSVVLFMGSPTPGVLSGWDAYEHITRLLAFSRLVYPTTMGFGNTAELKFEADGKLREAVPGPCRGMGEVAFTIPNTRNWLALADCHQIKSLMEKADLKKLPARVARAHWNFQHAAYQYFFEVRSMLVASALDALVHVRGTGSNRGPGTSRQFIERTIRVAAELNIPFSKNDAQAFWDHRSDVAHGRDPWAARRGPKGELDLPELSKDDVLIGRYLIAERILREAILRCLTDPTFASKFESDRSVEQGFPI